MHEVFPLLLISGFGAFVTLVGLILFTRSREQGQNRIRLLGFEAELSAPSLVIFVLGVFLTVFPWIDRAEEQPEQIEAVEAVEEEKELALALRLSALACNNATGFQRSGRDSPFIKVNGETVWGPVDVNCPTTTAVSLEVARRVWLFEDNNRIELWESDSGQRRLYGEDDRLGEAAVTLETGIHQGIFVGDSGHYTLTWQVVEEAR
jgi:hypothetical protein